ncbi:MAG: sulfatase-like hydrolase/transferase [Phycisphaerae bacterium]
MSALLAAAGCSDPDPVNSSDGSQRPATPKDPLANAPAEWSAFLRWAEKQLQTRPQAVPLPDAPNTAQPRWALVRLDDAAAFRKAAKTCNWTAPALGSSALAEVGPLRSDQPTPRFRVTPAPKATPDGKDSLSLTIHGLELRREDVGSVELTMSVPFGRHVTLKWSKAGTVPVPVEAHDRPFAVHVLTDGFAEWRGPLRTFSIITDGRSQGGLIEIHSLRFMPRRASYPEPIGIKRVRLGHEIRTAIYTHCPAEITFDRVLVPPNAKLHVGIGHVTGTDPGVSNNGATETSFEITVSQRGEPQTVLAQQIDTNETWTDASASLAPWGGQEVTLTLKCTSARPDTVAFWANPIIYEPVADPPMVVLYLIDTVASEHVNFHGYARETMPRLTTMAAHGVWFSQMFSNSSRTIESIPDLMLSMPVERHGVHHNSTLAPEGLMTIAEALRAAGFATASFCTNVNAGPRQGMDQGFDTFVDKIGYYWTSYDRTIPLDEVLGWIEQHDDRPLFLYVHTAEPHAPYTPPAGFAGHFDPNYTGRIDGSFRTFRAIRDLVAQQRDLQHVVALYDEEILYSDARFGTFLDALQKKGLLAKTHFFVTSDHGEEFLQHGHWEHGLNLHNEQTRVPLVAYGPTFASGVRVDAPVQLFDVMPTILDLFDLPVPYPLAGRSLLPLLRGASDSGKPTGGARAANSLLDVLHARKVYASNHNYRISRKLIEYSVIEAGRWKLLYGAREFPMYPSGPRSRFLLFDLEADRFERRNVIHDRPEVARRLIADLVRWRAGQLPYDPGVRAPTEIDRAQMEQLQALGYVGDDTTEDHLDDEPTASEPNQGADE